MSNPTDQEINHKKAIVALIDGGASDDAIATYVAKLRPADIATVLDGLESSRDKVRVFETADNELASDVVRKVGDRTRSAILEYVSDTRLASIVDLLDTDDAADFVADLPEHRKSIVLRRTDPETRRDVEELLTYDEDSAGGIMKTEVAHVRLGATVRQVTEYLRQGGEIFHDVHNVFVTDREERLVGYVSLRRLILSADSTLVDSIMEQDVISVDVDLDQEEVAHLFERYELLSVPVIEREKKLVGRITVDDIVDVISEEATEDILRLAGVAAETVEISDPAKVFVHAFHGWP